MAEKSAHFWRKIRSMWRTGGWASRTAIVAGAILAAALFAYLVWFGGYVLVKTIEGPVTV